MEDQSIVSQDDILQIGGTEFLRRCDEKGIKNICVVVDGEEDDFVELTNEIREHFTDMIPSEFGDCAFVEEGAYLFPFGF